MYRMIDEGRFGIRVGDQVFRLDTEDEQDNLDVEERREAHVVNPYWDYEANAPMNEECPDEVDHRSTQTSIKDQGDRGTCVCFASLANLEAIVKAQSDEELDLSEQYANWLFMKQQGRGQCDDGLRTTLAARYLSAYGICEEFHNPITPTKIMRPCRRTAPPHRQRRRVAKRSTA
jgi:C1A family cysteine protease